MTGLAEIGSVVLEKRDMKQQNTPPPPFQVKISSPGDMKSETFVDFDSYFF